MTSDPSDAGRQSSETGRRRARWIIPVAFVVAILLVMLFIYLVSTLNR
ncbi:hypothetical protein ACI797_27120 [Geodermatophilus sp. SYSU D00691]